MHTDTVSAPTSVRQRGATRTVAGREAARVVVEYSGGIEHHYDVRWDADGADIYPSYAVIWGATRGTAPAPSLDLIDDIYTAITEAG